MRCAERRGVSLFLGRVVGVVARLPPTSPAPVELDKAAEPRAVSHTLPFEAMHTPLGAWSRRFSVYSLEILWSSAPVELTKKNRKKNDVTVSEKSSEVRIRMKDSKMSRNSRL